MITEKKIREILESNLHKKTLHHSRYDYDADNVDTIETVYTLDLSDHSHMKDARFDWVYSNCELVESSDISDIMEYIECEDDPVKIVHILRGFINEEILYSGL